ncbi:ethanolamine ammonia-lyase subunit EutB [bacterium]|nr:ethanolamine ammonia-lyase subunit EutB [bacterium]
MWYRRRFLQNCLGSAAALMFPRSGSHGTAFARDELLSDVRPQEDVFTYLQRQGSGFTAHAYKRVLGAANEFKEGDQIVGVAAPNEVARRNARELLSRTRLEDIDRHPLLEDKLHAFATQCLDSNATTNTAGWTLGELKHFLLTASEDAIKETMPGLSSDVIGCVVKLMSNEELTAVGATIFNPLPGSQIGARGYLGARIQPNSPTDNVDDIRWQVLDAFAYAVGDVLLGTNPVSSDPKSVAAVERTLQDILVTFGIDHLLPHCVLAHIDVQAEVEQQQPGSTEFWFQSIAGSEAANATFDTSVERMRKHAAQRTGRFGLYFETGQGADFTNGHSHGFDMVLHESRKYGFARALTQDVAAAQRASGQTARPWVHLNDVAGFIGPEVFRTREQLVRCCLEDIVMGKLHGLTLGLDVCSTLHMSVTLDDLDWCLDQIVPACPAYLMALPTKIDPMLGYLTTGFQDHVRLRTRFGRKVNDAMWRFFQSLQVIDETGHPTEHFGDPLWVWMQYRRRKNDPRSDEAILAEGRQQLEQIQRRGVFIARGHGADVWDLEPQLRSAINRIDADARQSIWTEMDSQFIAAIPHAQPLVTRSKDRLDYILHPESGEHFGAASMRVLQQLRQQHAGQYDLQIVVSDGLNAHAIMDEGHLQPFFDRLGPLLIDNGYQPAPELLVVTSGRVRAGYRIGEILFGGLTGKRRIVHVIGERPGSGHHTFSVYMTSADGADWIRPNKVDHNITKVISGIALTALTPREGAENSVRILKTLG